MACIRFHVEAEVSWFYISPLLICTSSRDVIFLMENGRWNTKCSTFQPFGFLCQSYSPACRFPVAFLPSIGADGWRGKSGRCPRGRPIPVLVPSPSRPVPIPSPLPPELSLQHLRASGRLARRLGDVLLIPEMPEQSTRCEQHLNAVCPESAGQAGTLVVWGACLFIFSLSTDLVPRSRLIEDSVSAEIVLTEETGLNI